MLALSCEALGKALERGLGLGGHAAATCSSEQQWQQRVVRASRGLQNTADPVAWSMCAILMELCRQRRRGALCIELRHG
eukprot:scaffold2147_cov16-Tisochrysis_lutea.AAC.1